jgi:hypothetical protein
MRRAYRPQVEALEARLTPTVSFDVQQSFGLGSFSNSVVVADFNGDGKPDFAVSNSSFKFIQPSIGVMLNTTPAGASTASFAYPTQVAVLQGELAVGDFNGDGKPDLAVANNGAVAILLNTTPTGSDTPSFAAPQSFAAGSSSTSVAVGDFNGDGKPDLAVIDASGTVSILLNTTATGSVSFAAPQTFAAGTNPGPLAVADFNGDGMPDLAFASQGSNAVSVLLDTTATGSGTVSFAAPQAFAVGTGPASLAVADFNGDGMPDLAVANSGTTAAPGTTVSVLLYSTPTGSGTASFTAPQTFTVGTGPFAVAVADFNGDGKPDLAVETGTNLAVLVSTTPALATAASFAAPQTFTTPYGSFLAAGDFNGDGRPDLALSVGEGFGGIEEVVQLNTSFSAVVGQFGGQGVWQYDNATGAWTQLTGANASLLTTDSLGDVAGVFPGAGVWLYMPRSGWQQINGHDANALAMNAQGDIVANFPGTGVAEFVHGASGWSVLTAANASLLALNAQGDVAGEFPEGVWEYLPSTGWRQLTGANASQLGIDALGDVAGVFPGAGVWLFKPSGGGWQQINGVDATALTMDEQGDIVANFHGFGVGEFVSGGGWTLLTAANASALTVADVGVVAGAFGGLGVWEFDPVRGWVKITASNASLIDLV